MYLPVPVISPAEAAPAPTPASATAPARRPVRHLLSRRPPDHEHDDRDDEGAAHPAQDERRAMRDERAQLGARLVAGGGELLGEVAGMARRPPAGGAEQDGCDPEPERGPDPGRREAVADIRSERDPE